MHFFFFFGGAGGGGGVSGHVTKTFLSFFHISIFTICTHSLQSAVFFYFIGIKKYFFFKYMFFWGIE